MKKHLIYCLVGALSVASSCTDDVVYQNNDESVAKTAVSPYRIPLEEALSTAEGVLNDINPKTRGAMRRVASVNYVSSNSAKTRSGESDTLFYLVNYQDNSGFAILSADRRLAPVYAISDEGHLEMSDTIDNPALAAWMNGVIGTPPPIIGDSISLKETIVTRLELREIPRMNNLGTWHQARPFSKFCFTSSGEQAVAGCLAMAVSSIIAYNEWPVEKNGYTFDWKSIKNYNERDYQTAEYPWFKDTENMIAHLVREVGNPSDLEITYGNDTVGSYANFAYVKRTFVNWGYQEPKFSSTFKDSDVMSLLMKHKPILVAGVDYDFSDKGVFHSWVIDGFYQYAQYRVYGNPEKPVRSEKLYDDYAMYHCIWGLGGNANGFYYFGHDDGNYFDMNDRQDFYNTPYDYDPTKPMYYKFKTSLQYYYDIIPLK